MINIITAVVRTRDTLSAHSKLRKNIILSSLPATYFRRIVDCKKHLVNYEVERKRCVREKRVETYY